MKSLVSRAVTTARLARNRLRRRAAFAGRVAGLQTVADQIVEGATPRTLPLIMVSQAQRSGGSLMAMLLDGHSQLAVYPGHFHVMPTKMQWPDIDPSAPPGKLFDALFDAHSIRNTETGYSKKAGNPRVPCFVPPVLQRRIFLKLAAESPPKSRREALDLYLSAYQQAWLNRRSDLSRVKRVAALQPLFVCAREEVDRFFEDYPDGHMVSVLRDPWSWYASTVRIPKANGMTPEWLCGFWTRCADAALRHKQHYGSRFVGVDFTSLVQNTEPVMQRLAESLGLPFEQAMTVPTFNGSLAPANSTFGPHVAGEIFDSSSHADKLTRAQRDAVSDLCGETYDRARQGIDIG